MRKLVHNPVSGDTTQRPAWPAYTFLEKSSAVFRNPLHPRVAIHERGILRGGSEEDRMNHRSWFVRHGMVEKALMPAPCTEGKLADSEKVVVWNQVCNEPQHVDKRQRGVKLTEATKSKLIDILAITIGTSVLGSVVWGALAGIDYLKSQHPEYLIQGGMAIVAMVIIGIGCHLINRDSYGSSGRVVDPAHPNQYFHTD
jgi:hypothetical protein